MPLHNCIRCVISVINTFARANTCCPRSYLLPGPRGARAAAGGGRVVKLFGHASTVSELSALPCICMCVHCASLCVCVHAFGGRRIKGPRGGDGGATRDQ